MEAIKQAYKTKQILTSKTIHHKIKIQQLTKTGVKATKIMTEIRAELIAKGAVQKVGYRETEQSK